MLEAQKERDPAGRPGLGSEDPSQSPASPEHIACPASEATGEAPLIPSKPTTRRWDGEGVMDFDGTAASDKQVEVLLATPVGEYRLRAGSDPSDGVLWIAYGEDDSGHRTELPPLWICSPLRVASMTRSDRSDSWGRELAFIDADGIDHVVIMSMSLLAGTGEELRSLLLDRGVRISSDPAAKRRLLEYIALSTPRSRSRCVAQAGWHGDAFLLGERQFGGSGERIVVQADSAEAAVVGRSGTLAEWQSRVSLPCALNSRLALSIAAALAAPCLALLRMEGGGINLQGASSIGKTTALAVAASVYGPRERIKTWRQTGNSLEAVAALHSDQLLILDEMGELDPRDAGSTAYMLANGQGRGRARRDGSARPRARFRVLFLSSGEIGLQSMVAAAGGVGRAGQEIRVLELPADADAGFGVFDVVPPGFTPAEFADQLRIASGDCFGSAIDAFLSILSADQATATRSLEALRDAVLNELCVGSMDGQVNRAAMRFAAIAAAGEYASQNGVTGWTTGTASRAVTRCFHDWLDARGTCGASEESVGIRQVAAFLELHGESRFAFWDTGGDYIRGVSNRAGFRKKVDEGYEFFITRDVFRNEICKGIDHVLVAKVLIAGGALMPGSAGETTRMERLPDGRKVRVYRILPKLWEL